MADEKISVETQDPPAENGTPNDNAQDSSQDKSSAGPSYYFGLKKKKKAPKGADGDAVPVVASSKGDDSKADEKKTRDPSDKKSSATKSATKEKKKKPNLADFESRLHDEEGISAQQESKGTSGTSEKPNTKWTSPDRDYTYEELLERIFKILHDNNLELAGEKKYTIIPPQVIREGTKKSVFANLVDICKAIHRQPDHVVQYLFAELGTTGSIDSSQRLVIKGRFQQKQIENILKRYFADYVSCKTCKSADTILTKENRLFFVQCESCGSSRSVSAIKTGFVAQTQKRAVQRAAACN